MDDLKTRVLRNFEAYVRERDLRIGIIDKARLFLIEAVDDFLQRERQYGLGKTRQPSFNHRLFDEQIARAEELERRERERINELFGE